jgi:hypothetical protein
VGSSPEMLPLGFEARTSRHEGSGGGVGGAVVVGAGMVVEVVDVVEVVVVL